MPLNEYEELLDGQSPVQGNEYDRLLGEMQQQDTSTLQQSIAQAKTGSPDKRAQARQMADRLKVPVEMVERNPDLFLKQDAIATLPYEDLIQASPKLAEWLADPVNAGVAVDDVPNLQRVSQALSFMDSVRRGVDVGQSLFYGAAEATGELVGAEGLTAYGRIGRVQNEQQAATYGSGTEFAAIQGPWDLAQWAKETIGEQIPMFAPVAAGAGTGALVGTFVFPVVGTSIGAAIGAFIPAFAMGVGEVQSTIKERPQAPPREQETTQLTPDEETRFQQWARENRITDVDHPASFYDYRGYWKDVASKGEDQRKAYDDGLHFPDTYKQHGHPTFSVESKYSKGPNDGGRWQGETFIPAQAPSAPIAAFVGGSAIAALDTVLPGRIGSRLVRTFGRETAERIARRALDKPVQQRFVRRVVGSVVSGMSTEGLTEAVQEAVGEVFASVGAGTPVDWTALASQMVEAGAAGALVGGAAGGASEAVTPNPRVTAAQQGAQVLQGLGEALTNSKTAQRLPQAVESFIAQATKDGPVETVYAPIESWVTYWQSKGLDPAHVATDVTGKADAFEQAVATGADLPIPLARYAVTLAATEHNAFFANEIRLAPEQMNAREAGEFVKAQTEQGVSDAEVTTPQTAAPVREAVRTQLEGAGFEPGVAASYAQLYEAAFATLAERSGLDPMALYSRYGLEIVREGFDTRADTAQNRGSDGRRPASGSESPDTPALFDTLDTGEQQPRLPGAEDVRDQEVATPQIDAPFSLTPPVDKGKRGKQITLFQSVPVPFPTIDTRAASVLFRAADKSQAQRVTVPLSAIVATQATVDDAIVASKQGTEDPPLALAYGGKYYLADGTHRASAALARGDETIDVIAWPVSDDNIQKIQTYEAGYWQGARGKIQFGDASVRLELLRNADLSTFLHETGHFYLEVLRDLAGESASIAADLATLDATLFADATSETEKHERFARGFEAYLMEGRAPSPELRTVFARFRAWLTQIYKSLRGLNVELTPAVRGVFDRLLASDEAIAAAEAEGRIEPLFTDAAMAGVSPEQFDAYRATVEQASQQARDQLSQRFMREVRTEQSKQYKARRKQVRAEVKADLYAQPVYRARAAILRGTHPDGTSLVEGQPPVPMKGVPLDTLAELYGFSSGDELSQALKAAPPLPRAIKAETDRRMRAEFGDLLSDPAEIADQAQAAVYGEGRAKVIAAELKALTQGMAQGVVPPASAVNQIAESRIRGMRVRDLKPGLMLVAAQRASQRAFDAFAANDRATVIAAKQQELLSLAMYRAARDAQESAESAFAWVKQQNTLAGRRRLGLAGGDFLDEWDGVLNQYEFARASNAALDRRAGLRKFMASLEAQGLPVDLPESVVNAARTVNWRELTVDQLQAVTDTLKQIRHLGRLKFKLLGHEGQRQLADVATSVAERVYATAKTGGAARLTRSRTTLESVRKWGSNIAASILNPDTILRELDGWENLGPVYTALKGEIDRAVVEELLPRTAKAAAALAEINSVYREGELQKKEYIPALRDSMTREEMLAVALNWGTADNRAALLESKKFADLGATETTVAAILDRLDKRDWDYVQSVWTYINTFWPEIEASQRRRKGVAPTKVDAVPVATKFGAYKGGYYPLKYDPDGSILATQDQIEDAVQRMRMGRFAAAQTRDGFARERVGSGGRPVLLSLGVLQQHVSEVIYDLSLGDPIRNADRVLRSKPVLQAFEDTGAKDAYTALELWLHDVASSELVAADGLSRTFRWLRVGLTVSALGFNVGTVLIQPTGIAQTFAVLNKRDALGGVVDLLTRPWVGAGNVFAQVADASAFMATRQSTYNKDILTAMETVRGTSTVPQWAIQSGFYALTKAQWLVDVATWLGAHRQGLREFEGDADKARAFADRAVARAQASGLWADRSAFERGTVNAKTRQSEFVRMWTTLGSYMFAKGNVLYEKTRSTNFRNPASVIGYTVDVALLFAVEAMLVGLLRGTFNEDDDAGAVAWTWLKETAKGVVATVPFVREVGSEIEGFRGGGVVGSFAQRAAATYRQLEQGEFDAAAVKAVNSLGGVLFHYPSSQMNRFVDASWRAAEGEDVPLADYFVYREAR